MRFGVPILRHAHVTVCPLAPTLEHSSEPKSGPGERAICLGTFNIDVTKWVILVIVWQA